MNLNRPFFFFFYSDPDSPLHATNPGSVFGNFSCKARSGVERKSFPGASPVRPRCVPGASPVRPRRVPGASRRVPGASPARPGAPDDADVNLHRWLRRFPLYMVIMYGSRLALVQIPVRPLRWRREMEEREMEERERDGER